MTQRRNRYGPPAAPDGGVPHTATSRRPGGITLLCVLLGWLAVAGFGNTAVLFSQRVGFFPPWVGVVTLAYALTASVAVVGLWRVRRWGPLALRAWMAVCLVLLGCFVALIPSRLIWGDVLGAVGFTMGVAVLFWALDRYVRRRIGP